MRRTILVLILLATCGKSAPQHPNVLLVTIDTLRPDVVGPGTPALNAFFREAVRFRNTRTVAPLTLPAHTSMLTGLIPAMHGVHDNVTEPLPPRKERSFPLLAEQFRDAGYATAAFVARPVLAPQTGVGSGFDLYDCPKSEGEWQDEGGYIPGEERVRAPLAWLEGVPPGKPWFCWVHLYDPHWPYHPFAGDAHRAPTREGDSSKVLYGGEVSRADAALERLLREVAGDTVVVIASDHGDALGDHGEDTHGSLCYGSTIDVLLAVRGPGFARGAEDRGLRSVADIAPTLRRLCDLPRCDSDGADLGGAPHEMLVAESLYGYGVHGWGQVFSVTDGRHSLIEAGPSLELFDRRQDPGETVPLKLTDPAYEKLDRALEAFRVQDWGSAGGEYGEMLGSVSPYGDLRRRSLAYLSRRENAKLSNPRDKEGAWKALELVPLFVRVCKGRGDQAGIEAGLRQIDEIQKAMPESPRVDHCRAWCYATLADVTRVPSNYTKAAWSEIAAIQKGYVQSATIVPAIEYCVAGSDPDALRALVKVLRRCGKELTGEPARALAEAARTLGLAEADSSLPVR